MLEFVYELKKDLDTELYQINIDEAEILRKAERSVCCINEILQKLKVYVRNHKFASNDDEILFFKEIKPSIYSKLIFFIKIFNIESKRPTGSDKSQKRYLINELNKVEQYFTENLEFYQYFRNSMTYLDDKYFLRGKLNIRLYVNTFIYDADPDFSTSHDYKVAKIMSNDLLCVYLKTELAALDRKEYNRQPHIMKSKYTWTDSKIALVELIYALQASGSINCGMVEIKEIAKFFETFFGIELGDYYRTYLEIKNRQNPPKFLDSMRAALMKKIEEQDE